jgi:Ser/Thr protein kinase RdoA (MazF antagonist)
VLDSIATLTEAAEQPGGSALRFPLHLRRAWQRDLSRLGLQYVDAGGGVVPGQWWADKEQTADAHARLERAVGGALLARAGDELVLLQPGGADLKLPALGRVLGEPGAELLTHRPGRRAVVRLQTSGGTLYAKALRPSKVDRVRRAGEFVARLPARGFDVPETHSVDETGGLLVVRELPGRCLHDLAESDPSAFIDGCGRAGRALRSLHETAPAWITVHGPAAEMGMLRDRVAGVGAFVPAWHDAVRSASERVGAALGAVEHEAVVLHRDFYDKQIMIDANGRVGLLDFDTLGAGEAALDLANMLAHLELRVLQGTCSRETAAQAAAAFVDGYDPAPATRARVPAYLDASRLRLAMLYAFWPKWTGITPRLLGSLGRPTAWGSSCTPVAPTRGTRRVRGPGDGPDAPCPLVFVLGCPRSGTTMLERMLDAHRDLAMTHETHWVTKHAKRRRDLTRDGLVRPDTLDAMYADDRFVRMAPRRDEVEALMADRPLKYRRLVRLVFDHFRRSRGKRFVGDKSTGGYLRDIGRLREMCPDSKIVHLVRDGRDVCLSMLGWPKAARAAGRFPMFRDDPVATTAAWWQWHVRAGMEQGRPLGAEAYREMRYEDLVSEPEQRCAQLCEFLGLDPDPAMAAFHAGRSRPGQGRSANAAWLAPTPGLRDWRSQMRPEQIEVFEAIAGDTLASFGYERRFPRVSPQAAELAAERVARWEYEVGGAGMSVRQEVIITTGIPLPEGELR